MISISAASFGSSTVMSRWLLGFLNKATDPTMRQIVFSQGDPADFIFYVQTGRVKVTVVSEEDKEAVVAILQSGAFFGEECLTGHKLRMATVTALSGCF